jgi:outer membrane autotransporter protein
VKVNLWREFSGRDSVVFAGTDSIAARRGTTALELGLGVTARVTSQFSFYAGGGYTTNLGGRDIRAWTGNAGLRLTW